MPDSLADILILALALLPLWAVSAIGKSRQA